jgi:predicted amidohydrolase
MMNDLLVSLVQSSPVWEDAAASLQHLDQVLQAQDQPAHVIVLPEMFSTGFSMQPEKYAQAMDGSAVAWMRAMAKEKNAIVTGSLMTEENGQYFNRLLWVLPNGKTGHYDKRHLFAFANEHLHYGAGKKRMIARVNGWKICLQVCYDLRFPVWARQRPAREGPQDAQPEYDVLIYVANWPSSRSHAWKVLLHARAIENQCYVIGVNRVGTDGNGLHYAGGSLVVGPLGETLYQANDQEEIQTQRLSFQQLKDARAAFPFLQDGDDFLLL